MGRRPKATISLKTTVGRLRGEMKYSEIRELYD